MSSAAMQPEVLHTSIGDFPLHEYQLALGGRRWSVLHTEAMLTNAEESSFFQERLPYGVALWPSAIALAHELVARAGELGGRTVLELGAGTGLPGIVAASLGARVVQTDRQELVMSVCKRNGRRNGADSIDHRLVDWTEWDDAGRYDWIIGSDILYAEAMQPHLRRIFASGLAPGGRLLVADPFREPSLRLLESMERDGWSVAVSTWRIGAGDDTRPMGVFELAPP